MILANPIISFKIKDGDSTSITTPWILALNFWSNTGVWYNSSTWEGAPLGTVFGYDLISGYSDLIGSQPDAIEYDTDIVVGGVDIVSTSDLSVSTYTELGVFNETPANSTVPCELGDFSGSGYTNGINTSSDQLTFNGSISGRGKYYNDVTSDWVGAIISNNGFRIRVISTFSSNGLTFERLGTITDTELQDNFERGNELAIDWSRSLYTESEVDTLRDGAGDSTGGFPAAVQIDTTGNFEVGFLGQALLDAATNNQVLFESGDLKVFTNTTQIIADINGTQSALTKTLTSLGDYVYLKYNSGNLSIIAGGDESTPVAASSPNINGYFQIGADQTRANQAEGIYSGFYFRVV